LKPDDGSRPHSKGFLEAHLWIILLAMVLSVLAAVPVFALRPTEYVASASVIVKPEVFNGVPTAANISTEAAIASSGNVAIRAARLLHKPEEVVRQGLSVSSAVDTTVLRITFKGATPSSAYNGASAVTRAYVDYRNRGGSARVAEVITTPTMPTGPSPVNYTLVIALALMCGLLVGIAASVAWDFVLGARTRWPMRHRALSQSAPRGRADGSMADTPSGASPPARRTGPERETHGTEIRIKD
jgi:uncharacterized protein involved in exopolysaccharide biosynthesis